MTFGAVGAYERLSGRVQFAVDPEAAENAVVVDLERAPRNADGLVEFAADFDVLKPVEMARGNRRLIYDVANRGNKPFLRYGCDSPEGNDPISEADAGNGYLMRKGYTVVWSAWQGDMLPGDGRLTMDVPVATDDGSPINGPVRAEFIAEEPGIRSAPLSWSPETAAYPSVSLDTTSATLTRRRRETDSREAISADGWQFARVEDDGAVVASERDCAVAGGFEPGTIYELVYTARDPLVLGLGFVGVRDLLAFLRFAEQDDAGVANPVWLADGGFDRVYGWGISQSGRYLREYVYLGFNDDGTGRRVFDGVIAHVAGAGRVALNQRFAQASRYPRSHEDHTFPSDQFPFAYPVMTDPLTGKTDGILKRPETDPLVMHTQTCAEYWSRRGSLAHTDALGEDLPVEAGVRFYHFASMQHSAGPDPDPVLGPHVHPTNPVSATGVMRGLLAALDAWSTDGTAPPESRVPRRSDGTGVDASEVTAQFPSIPGVVHPSGANRLFVEDRGPEFETRGIASVEPPVEQRDQEYVVLVPRVDVDGNAVPGIRTPDVSVPLATNTGWNGYPGYEGEPPLYRIAGSHFPFAVSAADREASGDARPSIAERYVSREAYVHAVAAAAQALVADRFLLAEDAERYVERARRDARVADALEAGSPAGGD
jgi:hypothetical protein